MHHAGAKKMIDPLQPVVKKDLSMTTTKATLLSFVFGLPIACLLMGLYLWRWGTIISLNNTRPISFLVFFIGFLTTLILGIVIHELIHGLTWAIAGHKPLSAIKFGIQWQTLTPYAHYRQPMEVQAYRLGVIMPLIVLGILPSLIGILTGNGWSMFFGFIFTLAASGDMLVLWLIRGVERGQLVQDHPTQVGCYLIETQD
jgi:hypothetical protein